MKKIFIFLPVFFALAACSSPFSQEVKPVDVSVNNCRVEDVCKNFLPPISAAEARKTFTYEDGELGIRMQYPGSCYFNKGYFQCANFSMSIWPNDDNQKLTPNPQIKSENNKTELKYYLGDEEKSYFLLAWYDGQENQSLENDISKIAQSVVFIK